MEGISRQQTGTAGSELMKRYRLWLIIYFNGVSSPPAMHTSPVTQMPSWQVLHSLRGRESVPVFVALSDRGDSTGTKSHFLALSGVQDCRREIPHFESEQWLSDLRYHILFMALSKFFPPTYSLLGWCYYLKSQVFKALLAHSRGVLKTVKLSENTVFSPAELWVSRITHLYESFNPNSYLHFLFIHTSYAK